MDEENMEFQVPVSWVGTEDLPILFANSFVGQVEADQGVFFLTIGQMVPPALIGTPEERVEQLEQISYVPIKPVARLALTRERLEYLIAVLQTNLDQHNQILRARGGDEA